MADTLAPLHIQRSVLPWEKQKLRFLSQKIGSLTDLIQGSFETVLSSLPASLLLFDPSLKLIYANKNFHLEFEKDPSRLFHQGIEEALPSQLIQEIDLTAKIQKVFEGEGKRFEGQWEYRNAESCRHYHYQIVSIRGVDQKPSLAMILLDNVTERINLQHAICQERKRMKGLFDGMDIGLVVIKRDHTVEMINKCARSIFGFSSERRLVGRKCPQQFTPLRIAEILKSGSKTFFPRHEIEVNGSRKILEIHAFPLKDERKEVSRVIGWFKDVTEEKFHEESLHNMGKLASVGQLAAGIAHEIGNPLGIIAGTAQFCLQNLEEYSGLKKTFEVILRNAQNADRVIKELLHFTRPYETFLTHTSLVTLVKRACFLVETEYKKKRISIEERFPPQIPSIEADEHQLVQVFVNLLLNAIEACKHGGKILISISLDLKEKGTPHSGNVIIQIKDDGPGFPDEYLAKVFDPFFTTRPLGTGLGLSICRNIIVSHQGSITAENRRKGGAKITLTLPRERGRPHTAKAYS